MIPKILFVYCSWCGRFMWRVKFSWTSGGRSHGICRKCNEDMDALIEEV